MDDSFYKKIKDYLNDGTVPAEVPSTLSNFFATANKYKINKKQMLTRNGLICVRASEANALFNELHDHSGRIACWERIRQR